MITLDRPYTTLSKVKTHCGIDASNTDYDDDIREAINTVSRLIDSLTGRFYYKKTYTADYLNGAKSFSGWQIVTNDRGSYIYTPQMAPIIAVTSLIEDSITLVENTDFYLDLACGMIEKDGGAWNEAARAIKISCTIGYNSADTTTPSADIPGDIALFAIELAARKSGRYRKTIKNYVSGASETIDMFGVPKEIELALRNLRPIGLI
jgi:hypothetical protein